MTGVEAMTCERCGEPLERSYSTTAFSATAQTFQLGPDGSAAIFPRGGFVACSWNCLAVLAAKRASETGQTDAAVRIVAERERQVTQEGWSPEHDAGMPAGDLATAGVCYVVEHLPQWVEDDQLTGDLPNRWPWDAEWWKPKGRDRDLIRAGALIAAELDRDPARRTTTSDEAF